MSGDEIVLVSDLVAIQDVEEKGIFGRLWDKFVMWLMNFFQIHK